MTGARQTTAPHTRREGRPEQAVISDEDSVCKLPNGRTPVFLSRSESKSEGCRQLRHRYRKPCADRESGPGGVRLFGWPTAAPAVIFALAATTTEATGSRELLSALGPAIASHVPRHAEMRRGITRNAESRSRGRGLTRRHDSTGKFGGEVLCVRWQYQMVKNRI